LRLEPLESRTLLSHAPPGFGSQFMEVEDNDTLDVANSVGLVNVTQPLLIEGSVGDAEEYDTDVDWYQFTLDKPTELTLQAEAAGESGLLPVVGLYNHDLERWNDPYNPLGHRLLGRGEAAIDGLSSVQTRHLAPGTYFIAVSGEGNFDFHPFIADSGLPGAMGDYELTITGSEIVIEPGDGPVVLASSPNALELLDGSPFVVRINFDRSLDLGSIAPGANVLLIQSANETFGDGDDVSVPFAGWNFSTAVHELQLWTESALGGLGSGFYQLVLIGNTSTGVALLGGDGIPLGASAASPEGSDFTLNFTIIGSEGGDSLANDTPELAIELDDITELFTRVTGAIGDDPAYTPWQIDPLLTNRASDVDLYHFTISGPGQYALLADVFAGRIGSPLDPGLSLFRWNAAEARLELVSVNDSTCNGTEATNGMVPLFTDAALFVGLTEGEYYLAVSAGDNTPDAGQARFVGVDGVFDPHVCHSGWAGSSMGEYVLTLTTYADDVVPEVVSVSFADGTVLGSPPTHCSVRFSEPVALQQLAYLAFESTSQDVIPCVFILAGDGTRYYPRMIEYVNLSEAEGGGSEATFLMLDGLGNGQHELHFSGDLGLTDFAGLPIVSNHASSDYVVHFSVNGPARGDDGSPLQWTSAKRNDEFAEAQSIGVLFPHEIEAGVTFVRRAEDQHKKDEADYFRFEVLQARPYHFSVTGHAGVQLVLLDTNGDVVPAANLGDTLIAHLTEGVYVLGVVGWQAHDAKDVAYRALLSMGGSGENPPPLTNGPAPAVSVRFRRDLGDLGDLGLGGFGSRSGGIGPVESGGGTGFTPPPSLIRPGADSGVPPAPGLTKAVIPVVFSVRELQSFDLGRIPIGAFTAFGPGPFGGVGVRTEDERLAAERRQAGAQAMLDTVSESMPAAVRTGWGQAVQLGEQIGGWIGALGRVGESVQEWLEENAVFTTVMPDLHCPLPAPPVDDLSHSAPLVAPALMSATEAASVSRWQRWLALSVGVLGGFAMCALQRSPTTDPPGINRRRVPGKGVRS
jgi:hypothetical protein